MTRKLFFLFLVALVGCSSGGQTKYPGPVVEDVGGPHSERTGQDASGRDAPSIGGHVESSSVGRLAITELVAETNRFLGEGQLEKAAASAERAIRIAPTSAQAYFALAQVRFYQAQYGLSRSLLFKARSMTNNISMLRSIESYLSRPQYQ